MKPDRQRILGFAAIFTTVTIWAAFLLVTRFAVNGAFTVEEILFLRLVPGALLMAPVMWRLGVVPRGLTWPGAALVMFGATALFPYLVSMGLAFAPASDGGALAPGMLPFWTALAAYLILGEVPGPRRRIGLGLILAGATIVSLWQILAGAGSGAWRGHLLFLGGSGLWAVYSVVFRASGLTPLHALAIGLFWGTILFLPWLLWSGLAFENADAGAIVLMAFLQSFVIGIVALFLFGYAVRTIGAAESAAFGALTPILALLGGALFLDEAITPLKAGGVFLVAFGVFMASGVMSRAPQSAPR